MNIQELTTGALTRIGLTPKLIEVTEERIPPEIRLIQPRKIGTGYGLVGGTGSGKSSAQAWQIKQLVQKYIERFLTRKGIGDYDPDRDSRSDYLLGRYANYQILWTYWPDAALKIQEYAYKGMPSSAAVTPPWHPDKLKQAKILILDDLGREKLKVDSFAVGQLDSVVAHREQHGMTTLWNSNLDIAGLIDQYGIATVDRLRGLAPFPGSEWIDLRSLR